MRFPPRRKILEGILEVLPSGSVEAPVRGPLCPSFHPAAPAGSIPSLQGAERSPGAGGVSVPPNLPRSLSRGVLLSQVLSRPPASSFRFHRYFFDFFFSRRGERRGAEREDGPAVNKSRRPGRASGPRAWEGRRGIADLPTGFNGIRPNPARGDEHAGSPPGDPQTSPVPRGGVCTEAVSPPSRIIQNHPAGRARECRWAKSARPMVPINFIPVPQNNSVQTSAINARQGELPVWQSTKQGAGLEF